MASQYQVPDTPRVISPSPTPSDVGSERGGYFTRSKTKGDIVPIDEHEHENEESAEQEEDPELQRARPRGRGPQYTRKGGQNMHRANGTTAALNARDVGSSGFSTSPPLRKRNAAVQQSKPLSNGAIRPPEPNSFLSPSSAYGKGAAYWRSLSRSPSPLGLIPIHREWRAFVHKHEIPRKALHVSIGFVTLWLYYEGAQTSQIHPALLYALIPILSVDLIRFRWPAFNRFYIRVMGAFMREAEAHDRFNGVISYLAGLWVTMRFCPKDVAVMSVLLLSWCDTAASTFGRAFGRYTPRIRRGKSLAGSLAAFSFGVAIAVGFWGWIAPATELRLGLGQPTFAYGGFLRLPIKARETLGLSLKQGTLEGPAALGVLSIATGIITSVSEAIDLFGLDDNLTIPILCGVGLSAFLWAFGGS